jgi:hypothetical protein
MGVRVARSEPELGAGHANGPAGSAEGKRLAIAAGGPAGADARTRKHAVSTRACAIAESARTVVANEAERRAVCDAALTEGPVWRAYDEHRVLAVSVAQLRAVRVVGRFADRRLLAVTLPVLLARDPWRARRAFNGLFVTADDGSGAIAPRLGGSGRTELGREARLGE